MKSFLKTISCVSLLSLPTLAFGQSPTDMSNFSFRLKLQTRFDLTDSYRTNQGDLFTTTARTGLNYNYKNVFGIIEFQGGSAADPYTASSTTTASSTNGQQEMFVVRRAYVGMDVVNSDMAKISFLIGRDHNTASIVYGPDAFTSLIATNVDNMSGANSQDGIALRYAGKFGFGDVKAQVGYYNNFPITILNGGTATGSAISQSSPFGTSSKGVGDATFNSQSKTGSRAYAGQIGANVNMADGVVEARAFYSMQPEAVTKVNSSTSYDASTISNVEASLGYNYKSGMLKGGLWVQSYSYGKTQNTAGSVSSNSITYVENGTDDSFTANVIGLGVTGTSDLFGINSLLASGDKLTYGLAVQSVQGQNFSNNGLPNGVTKFTNQTPSLTFYNIAAGYAQGNYSLELNFVGVSAEQSIYAGNDGQVNQNSAYMAYIVGTIAL